MNRQKLLVVDGYNVINAWKSVSSVQGGGREWLADARDQLTAKLQNYAGYTGQKVVLVFDAYLSQRPTRTEEQMGPVTVVYTQGERRPIIILSACAISGRSGRNWALWKFGWQRRICSNRP